MSWYHRPEPIRIEIGSEYVTVLPTKYGSTQTARILRREDDEQGQPVKLVLDRILTGGSTFKQLGKQNERGWHDEIEWRASGCVATVLSRVAEPATTDDD